MAISFELVKPRTRKDIFIRILLLLSHGKVLSEVIDCLTINQSPIDPPPLLTSNDTMDAILYENTSTPIILNLDFDNVSETAESDTYMTGQGRVCYNEESLNARVAVPDGSNFTVVRFFSPYFRDFAVLEPYSFTRHATKIQFNTSWLRIQGNYDDLIESIHSNTILNVSFLAYVTPYQNLNVMFNTPADEVQACNYVIDWTFCHTSETSWTMLGTTPSAGNSPAVCKIPFTRLIDKYKEMWLPQGFPSLEFRKRCYIKGDTLDSSINQSGDALYLRYGFNDGIKCGRKSESDWPEHNYNFFRVGAKGKILKMAIGKNKYYNIDLTIDVSVWNDEFYQYFADMYRDKDVTHSCSGNKPKLPHVLYKFTNLTITYFTAPIIPVPERGIPFYTWVFLVIMSIPAISAVFALLMIITTRSLQGFDPGIWKFWMLQRNATKMALERNKLMMQSMGGNSASNLVMENSHAV